MTLIATLTDSGFWKSMSATAIATSSRFLSLGLSDAFAFGGAVAFFSCDYYHLQQRLGLQTSPGRRLLCWSPALATGVSRTLPHL